MTNAEAKLQIFLYFSNLKVQVAERQYSFIMNISAIAAGAIAFLFKDLLKNSEMVKFSFLAFLLSLIVSILLMFFSAEFDAKVIRNDEKFAEDALLSKKVDNSGKGEFIKKILNTMYYFSFISFLIGIILVGISTLFVLVWG